MLIKLDRTPFYGVENLTGELCAMEANCMILIKEKTMPPVRPEASVHVHTCPPYLFIKMI